nr:adenosine receptor A2a [Anolis sagrei ordinatus]
MLGADFALYVGLELALAGLAVAGNVLVVWAVLRNRQLQSVTHLFVASLAVADVAVGVLAVPFAVAISTGFCAAFRACLFIACFVLVLTQSSIFSLLAIALDRAIAIRMPLRYNALVTGSRAKALIAICWALSFAIGLTPLLGWHRHPLGPGNGTEAHNCSGDAVPCLFEGVVTMEYMVYYNFFACVLVPLLLMLGIYLKIFLAARRQLKQMGAKMAPGGERSCSTLQKEVHAAKSLAIIVGLFAICWLPLHILNCYTLFCRGCARAPQWLMYVAILLSHANSVVNPLIYAYRIREFRITFRKILGHHILCRNACCRRKNKAASSSSFSQNRKNGESGVHFATSAWGGEDSEANGDLGGHHSRSNGAMHNGEAAIQELLTGHGSAATFPDRTL